MLREEIWPKLGCADLPDLKRDSRDLIREFIALGSAQ